VANYVLGKMRTPPGPQHCLTQNASRIAKNPGKPEAQSRDRGLTLCMFPSWERK
jgi:hypothetical protein